MECTTDNLTGEEEITNSMSNLNVTKTADSKTEEEASLQDGLRGSYYEEVTEEFVVEEGIVQEIEIGNSSDNTNDTIQDNSKAEQEAVVEGVACELVEAEIGTDKKMESVQVEVVEKLEIGDDQEQEMNEIVDDELHEDLETVSNSGDTPMSTEVESCFTTDDDRNSVDEGCGGVEDEGDDVSSEAESASKKGETAKSKKVKSKAVASDSVRKSTRVAARSIVGSIKAVAVEKVGVKPAVQEKVKVKEVKSSPKMSPKVSPKVSPKPSPKVSAILNLTQISV